MYGVVHTECVGISDIDAVRPWACAYSRQLPKTVKHMKTQLETLFESTSQILNTIGRLTENM